ncbi:hypothetical protein ABPG74_004817 [Tetrahymena malaccensis]
MENYKTAKNNIIQISKNYIFMLKQNIIPKTSNQNEIGQLNTNNTPTTITSNKNSTTIINLKKKQKLYYMLYCNFIQKKKRNEKHKIAARQIYRNKFRDSIIQQEEKIKKKKKKILALFVEEQKRVENNINDITQSLFFDINC